ncbi:MAG: hypothetical protein WCR52_23950, partial [Bacteroidota bacterium]
TNKATTIARNTRLHLKSCNLKSLTQRHCPQGICISKKRSENRIKIGSRVSKWRFGFFYFAQKRNPDIPKSAWP